MSIAPVASSSHHVIPLLILLSRVISCIAIAVAIVMGLFGANLILPYHHERVLEMLDMMQPYRLSFKN